MDEKKQMRQAMKNKIKALSVETKKAWNHEIAAKLTALPEWQKAGSIGITVSTVDEIDTEPLVRKAWTENKRVAVPKADPKTKSMDFRVIRDFDDVEEAFAGIREPVSEKTEAVSSHQLDILIVPGLVFDEYGYRIGFGGGFYDRFLVNYHNPTISLAYECQLVERVPADSFDQSVDVIVTEKRIIRTANGK